MHCAHAAEATIGGTRTTFRGQEDVEALHGLVQDIEEGYVRSVAFVVPAGVSWSLPLYELALMTARRAWESWNRESSYRVTEIDGVGAVESWHDLLDVDGALVTFRSTVVFASDGAVIESESTLRFRDRDEVEADLRAHGYSVDNVRDAPDRPGRELVFFATRAT